MPVWHCHTRVQDMDTTMEASGDALEFLEKLKKQDHSRRLTFDHLMEYMERKARDNGVPLRAQIELTPLCNFDCRMCYTHLTPEQMNGRSLLSVSEWKKLLKAAFDAGMMSVNLTGGECLTYPGFEEIYLYLWNLGVEILVLTNGSLMNEKWIRFFKAHRPRLIQITLYGNNEDTYERVTGHRGFGTVSGHIRSAVEAGLPVVICITPSRYLGEDVFDTIRTAHSFGIEYTVNSFLSEPKEETGRAGLAHDLGIQDYARVFRFLNDLRGVENITIDLDRLPPPGGGCHEADGCGLACKAGLSCFTLEWDGRMYACSSIRDIWTSPLEEGFMPAWRRLHEKALGWPVIPECIECPYASVCTNCAPEKARYAPRGKQPLELCEQTRYLVHQGIKRMPDCEQG